MKTASPTTFPKEGLYIYEGVHIDLQCGTPGAAIYYTTDGSNPTFDSPVYNREAGLIPLASETKIGRACETETVIRAFAKADGFERSDTSTFHFVVRCPDRTRYYYRVLRMDGIHADLYCIEDYDSDKMYLLVGNKRAVLFDAGYDADGDEKSLVDTLCHGIPYDLVILHGHPDHIMQANRFIDSGITCYMSDRDLDLPQTFGYDLHASDNIDEGDVIDLGNSILDVYAVPGHTPGSLVAVERETGYVFSSDAFGSNRVNKPDSAWLQFDSPVSTIDRYLAAIRKFRAQTTGLTKLFCGHNDEILDIDPYLDNLETAVQEVVDQGEPALKPTLRSAAESFGSKWIAVHGNYQMDVNWAAVNVGRILTEGITPENNCTLSWIQFENASCTPAFAPDQLTYQLTCASTEFRLRPVKNSTRSSVAVNGKTVDDLEWMTARAEKGSSIEVQVTAPDGTACIYHFYC
jgi:glyoxylase-like metal-dependent hydrolase (beta-lactamase superfamily II)